MFVIQTIILQSVKKSVKVNEGSLGNTIFMEQFYFV